MTDRAAIVKALRNTFALSDTADIRVLSEATHVAQSIQNMPLLLSVLAQENPVPKTVAEALERVIVVIKTKEDKDRTPTEAGFLAQIEALVYKPMYASEVEHTAHHEVDHALRP